MQENKKRESRELQEELKWYTLYASDEEYDEKAVESIMYLLDRWEPLEEGTVPPVEESWKRFLQVAGRKELLPVGDADTKKGTPAGENAAVARKPVTGESAAEVEIGAERTDIVQKREPLSGGNVLCELDMKVDVKLERDASAGQLPGAENIKEDMAGNMLKALPEEKGSAMGDKEKRAGDAKTKKLARFVARHKVIAAAVLVLMVLMVGNTIHAVANPEMGFFFWLNKDDSGVKMMTSPEGLDGKTNKQENIFYNRDDVPEWAKGWMQIEAEIETEMQGRYELQYFEISELDNRQHIASHYWGVNTNDELLVGIWIYWDKVSYFKEEFLEYDFVQSYEFEQKEMDVYKRTEDTGRVYYIVCFYDGNCKYYVKGQENLDEIKVMAEDYWICVHSNL